MGHGRILADGSTESITGSGNKLRVAVKGNFQDARAALESLPGVLVRDAYTESEPGVFEFMLEHERGADIRTALFEALAQHRMPIYAPVSYTHLDVYKRQVQYRSASRPRP